MIGFPFLYIIFAMFIFDLSDSGIVSVLLSPLFYLASIFWIVSGVGLLRMQKWAWYTFFAAQFFITYLNALNLVHYSQSPTKGLAFGLTLLVQLFVYFQVRKEIRVPYLFPKINWWESGIAGMPHIDVQVVTESGMELGQILDLSVRGCFVKTPKNFKHFEKIKIVGRPYRVDLEVSGTVVWSAASSVTHPKGIGVKFYGLGREDKKRLKQIIIEFEKEKSKAGEVHAI